MATTLAVSKLKALIRPRMTQRALAAELGVSPTTLANWLRGDNRPTGAAIRRMAEVAGIPAGDWYVDAPAKGAP